MTAALVAGLIAGYAIAIPVGAVGAYLVTLTARTSLRVGAAAALGVASVDGFYALVAVLGGSALAGAIASIEEPLRWVAAAVLVLVAARMAIPALRRTSGAAVTSAAGTASPGVGPGRAFATLAGMTLVNPATVVYFAALVVGGGVELAGAGHSAVFVAAALVASASWQLVLAVGGSALGRVVTSDRGQRLTALAGALIVVVLAVRLVVSPG